MKRIFSVEDLDVFLVRMLAATLGRHIAGGALEDLEQGLLDAFAAHVPGDGDVVGLAADLVDFVDVNDADLGPLDVVIGRLEEAQDNVFHVFADITGLGERGGIGDTKGHIDDPGQGCGASRVLPLPVGPMREDVALVDLDIAQRVHLLDGIAAAHGLVVQDALVVIVHRHAQRSSSRGPGR